MKRLLKSAASAMSSKLLVFCSLCPIVSLLLRFDSYTLTSSLSKSHPLEGEKHTMNSPLSTTTTAPSTSQDRIHQIGQQSRVYVNRLQGPPTQAWDRLLNSSSSLTSIEWSRRTSQLHNHWGTTLTPQSIGRFKGPMGRSSKSCHLYRFAFLIEH